MLVKCNIYVVLTAYVQHVTELFGYAKISEIKIVNKVLYL